MWQTCSATYSTLYQSSNVLLIKGDPTVYVLSELNEMEISYGPTTIQIFNPLPSEWVMQLLHLSSKSAQEFQKNRLHWFCHSILELGHYELNFKVVETTIMCKIAKTVEITAMEIKYQVRK